MQSQDTLSSLIYQIAKTEQSYLTSLLAELGLNPDQARALDEVARHPGMNQRAVAEYLKRQAASTSNLLKGLSRRGWLERKPAVDNDREKHLFLTPVGIEMAAKISTVFTAMSKWVDQGLTVDQRGQLKPILKTLAQNLSNKK